MYCTDWNNKCNFCQVPHQQRAGDSTRQTPRGNVPPSFSCLALLARNMLESCAEQLLASEPCILNQCLPVFLLLPSRFLNDNASSTPDPCFRSGPPYDYLFSALILSVCLLTTSHLPWLLRQTLTTEWTHFPAISVVGVWIYQLTTAASDHLMDFPPISVSAVVTVSTWIHWLTMAASNHMLDTFEFPAPPASW